MPDHKYHILSTKEIPDTLLAEAATHGIAITAQPFINIRPIISHALKERVHQLLQEKAQVVFTSANAVTILQQHYLDADGKYYYGDWIALPPFTDKAALEQYEQEYKKGGFYSPGWEVYCLEGATLNALGSTARSQGRPVFRHRVIATAPDATALAQQLVQQGNVTSVVFFCGNKRRNELPDALRQHGIAVEEIVLYETMEAPAATGGNYDGILFFSPSGVKSFFSANRIGGNTACFALGRTTAAALQQITDNRIILSTGPTMEQMVHTAIFYFNNINCYE